MLEAETEALQSWRPVFWEPVEGTGERLMVGVVYVMNGVTGATRIIRDDVLDSLYGQQASAGAKKLIDAGLSILSTAARISGMDAASIVAYGLHPGHARATAAKSLSDLLRTAALLYSSLSNMDKLDSLDEADTPLAEEVNKRFSTEVREFVSKREPYFIQFFGRAGVLIDGGQSVKFGFLSATLVAHFSVLSPTRQSGSVRDARARLWELARAKEIGSIRNAALITAVPRADDATLGEKQKISIAENIREISREADGSNIRLLAVHSADEAASRLIEHAI